MNVRELHDILAEQIRIGNGDAPVVVDLAPTVSREVVDVDERTARPNGRDWEYSKPIALPKGSSFIWTRIVRLTVRKT